MTTQEAHSPYRDAASYGHDYLSLADILQKLRQPTPANYRSSDSTGSHRKGVEYITWPHVCEMLDEATQGRWSSEVTRIEVIEDKVIVGVKITIMADDGSVSRESIAEQPVSAKHMFPPYETAERTALKRAAYLFGVGNDLVGGQKAAGRESGLSQGGSRRQSSAPIGQSICVDCGQPSGNHPRCMKCFRKKMKQVTPYSALESASLDSLEVPAESDADVPW